MWCIMFKDLSEITNSKEYRQKRREREEFIVSSIYEQFLNGKIIWKRKTEGTEQIDDFTASVLILLPNTNKESIVKIHLSSAFDMHSFEVAYLMVSADNEIVCRNSFDSRIKWMYEKITGERLNE